MNASPNWPIQVNGESLNPKGTLPKGTPAAYFRTRPPRLVLVNQNCHWFASNILDNRLNSVMVKWVLFPCPDTEIIRKSRCQKWYDNAHERAGINYRLSWCDLAHRFTRDEQEIHLD